MAQPGHDGGSVYYQVKVKSREHGVKELENADRDTVLNRLCVPYRLGREFRVDGCAFRGAKVLSFKVVQTPEAVNKAAAFAEIDASSFGNMFKSMVAAGAKLDVGEDVTVDILAEADALIAAQGLVPEAPSFPGDVDPERVFVVTSFSPKLSENFEAITEVCSKRKLKAVRVDMEMSSAPIIDRIQRHLREAMYVIVDLTEAKPNVYYELGYLDAICAARGSDPAEHILLVAQSLANDAHFDVRHRGIEVYENPYQLMKTVERWLTERPK
jgi:hypothetical protein